MAPEMDELCELDAMMMDSAPQRSKSRKMSSEDEDLGAEASEEEKEKEDEPIKTAPKIEAAVQPASPKVAMKPAQEEVKTSRLAPGTAPTFQ